MRVDYKKIPDKLRHNTRSKVPKQLFCSQYGPLKLPLIVPPVRNDPIIGTKPTGGFWTSTYTPFSKYCSAWLEWCAYEEPEWMTEHCYIVTPKKNIRVYVIDSYRDLELLIESDFRYKPSGDIQPVFVSPDWEKMSQYWDAVMLTEKGERETRYTQPINLYGWDCESTLWFRDVFESVIPVQEDKSRTCKLTVKEHV